jgi:hypothetical protein
LPLTPPRDANGDETALPENVDEETPTVSDGHDRRHGGDIARW